MSWGGANAYEHVVSYCEGRVEELKEFNNDSNVDKQYVLGKIAAYEDIIMNFDGME